MMILNQDEDTRALVTKLAQATSDIVRSSAGQDQEQISQMHDNRGRLEIKLAERMRNLEQSLAERTPEFRRMLDRRQRGIDPAEIVAAIPADAALVDFLVYTHVWFVEGEPKSEQRVIAFIYRSGREVQQVNLGDVAPLEQLVTTWRHTYSAGDLRRLLWQPLEKHLDGVKLVLISPDGFLTGLLFAALPGKKDGEYLLHEYTFATIPIPALLLEQTPPKDASATMLVLGGIDFDEGEGVPAADKSPPAKWPALGQTRDELLSVRDSFERAFSDGQCKPLRGPQATKRAFVAAAPKARFVHVATHGQFADRSQKSALAVGDRSADMLLRSGLDRRPVEGVHPGLLSGLMFAGANRGKDADTRLTALEVGDMDLHAELVVLSACETGLGQVAGGEGVLGLQRAFQIAGARSVLASLWKVDDKATQTLMSRFYEKMWDTKNPMTKAEALRQAQLEILKEESRALAAPGANAKVKASPKSWAGFVLSGDWR